MKPNNKIWLVDEENPKPDPYIAILVREKEFLEQSRKKAYKVFYSTAEAIAYALKLKKQYQAKHIRLFYPDDISIIVKPANST